MLDMNPKMHPLDHPDFNKDPRKVPVWYLSHPLAADNEYSFQQNMEHVKHMMRLCFDCGIRVVAPYHTICMCLDDDNATHRRIGLETDCRVAYDLARIVLCGHKISRGMSCELDAVKQRVHDYVTQFNMHPDMEHYLLSSNIIINIVDLNDKDARTILIDAANG